MKQDEFDVIVVGAGMAGVACAGELVLQGAKPLLICETREVASTLRPCIVGKNHAMLQHPVLSLGWGGGYWYPLARDLNIPVKTHASLPFKATVHGSGQIYDLPIVPSASALTQVLIDLAPFPIDHIRETFGRLAHAALAIPYQELLKMDRVPMLDWMTDQGADQAASMMIVSLCANLLEIPLAQCTELSVLGAWGTIRTLLCGEGVALAIEPDPQTGYAMLVCDEVERRGGAVWRSSRVAQVLMSGDRVTGVALEDGREVTAPAVAIATGNPRIPQILNPLPDEAVEPVRYGAEFGKTTDFTIFTVLDKPVVKPEQNCWIFVINEDGSNRQISWPLHYSYPWSTEPGRQFVGAQANFHADDAAAAGGADAIFAEMQKTHEDLYPGFIDAIVEVGTQHHRHLWSSPLLVGPKLPRRATSVSGLYFVGDGSAPIGGMYVDAAASTGVLGARAIAADRTR